jgi:hypothetical protein
MEVPDALELASHWSEEPTPGMLLRAYFGIERKTKRTGDMADFRKDFGRNVRGVAGEARSLRKVKPHLAAMVAKAKNG